MENEDLSALLRQLDEAFGNLPIPADDRLVLNNSGYDLESNEIRTKFRGRHWRDLSPEDLFGEADSLGFFTPAAFRFFLPAFIRVSLLDPKVADLIPDSILWSFARPGNPKLWEERKELILETARAHGIPEMAALALEPVENPGLDAFCKERVAVLTDLQRQVVLNFIRFIRAYRADEFAMTDLDRAENALLTHVDSLG